MGITSVQSTPIFGTAKPAPVETTGTIASNTSFTPSFNTASSSSSSSGSSFSCIA